MKNTSPNNPYYSHTDTTKLQVSNEEWKKILPLNLYLVAREADTERAFTGTMWKNDSKGTYYCAVCGNKLFRSTQKFTSMCGWPSFFEPISKEAIIYIPDNSHGMVRTEVQCGKCKSHLGHVFEDGPKPTGLRYCINGVVLTLEK